MNKPFVIRAAEVGDYVFCHRAWWLRKVRGSLPVNETELRAGAQMHADHGARVRISARLQFSGYVLAMLAMLLVGLWMLTYLL